MKLWNAEITSPRVGMTIGITRFADSQIQNLCEHPKVSLTVSELSQLVLRAWIRYLLPKEMRENVKQATEKAVVLLDDDECRREVLVPFG